MSAGRARPGASGPTGSAEGDGEGALSVRGVARRYPGTAAPAVRDLDLSVGPGEVVAVIGESGCGKTTLLRLVAGLEVPDAGTISIGGRTVAGPGAWVPPERRGVGMVFQDFALFPHLRAVDNVAFGLAHLGRRERRRRAERMLERVGLASLAERHPHRLSGGQQQRVALARALAPRPRLLLLDEPFSNLDTPLKAELREELAEVLERSGVPTVLVVHDADDVFLLADRVAVMRAGRILQAAPPDVVYDRPADAYVARFFGDTNLLPARPDAGGLRTPLGPCAGDPDGALAGRVLVRPEHLRVSREEGEGASAVVRRTRPHGRRLRVWLALAEGESAGTLLTALADPALSLGVGDRVYVSARTEEMCVLAGSADGRAGAGSADRSAGDAAAGRP